jgi:hypothetical protein
MIPSTRNRAERRAAAKYIERESRKFGDEFVVVPIGDAMAPPGQTRALRNRKFLVQEFLPEIGTEDMVKARLSVNIIALNGDRWLDGIAWDELQAIKDALGYQAFDAVEVYPRATDKVDVANMRHLWVLAGLLPFAWRARG